MIVAGPGRTPFKVALAVWPPAPMVTDEVATATLPGALLWTVKVTPDACQVVPGKSTDSADCVLKTSPAMFTRIVREAYTPTAGEFMAGAIKSNNVALLVTFQKAFQLAGEER